MNQSSEQISEWTAKFEEWFDTQLTVAGIPRHIQQAYALHGYLYAKTEQAAEVAPFTPITANDVADEMVEQFFKIPYDAARKDVFVAAVNAYLGAKK